MSELESNEDTLAIAHAFATSRGGTCLSVEVASHVQRLHWSCAAGHRFEASLTLTRHAGYWCPTCAPSVDDTSGWDYDKAAERDPLLARFHTKQRY
jgi:hypothetical protein